MAPLAARQLFAIEISTRASSVASILGSLFIISTFLCFPYFRKPITRLIFYATWGNIVTNAATLISVSAIPADGTTISPLCEAQAFLIQWFMLADPFWVLCMALNVWLVFVRGYDAQKLHHLEKWYILFAYGLPAITAIIYLIHDHNSGQHIVGPAILWCWVGTEFDWMRIVFYYAPVWVLAGTTMSIYICVGIRIYRQRAVLHAFARKPRRFPGPSPSGALEDPFVTTESRIFVTTEIEHNVQNDKHTSRPVSLEAEQKWQTPSSSPEKSTFAQPADEPDSIRSSTPGSLSKSVGRYSLLVPLNPSSPQRHTQPLLISYRASAYAAPLVSGEFATLPSPRAPVFQPTEHAAHVKRRKENAAAYAYFNVAFLMFVALVIIWVPSSINRLYQIAYPDSPNYGLNIVSALVLPMQGVWNATIYASKTWSECKHAYETLISRLTGATLSIHSSIETDQDETIKYNANIEDGGIMVSFKRMFVPNSSAKTM